jgi:hypothetical protein
LIPGAPDGPLGSFRCDAKVGEARAGAGAGVVTAVLAVPDGNGPEAMADRPITVELHRP